VYSITLGNRKQALITFLGESIVQHYRLSSLEMSSGQVLYLSGASNHCPYIIRLGTARTFKIIWSSKENMVQFFRNQGQRSKTFFFYQISTGIPFSLKKDEKLHIMMSLVTGLNPAGYVISPEMAQFHRRPTDS
jgi:hypothetical protein